MHLDENRDGGIEGCTDIVNARAIHGQAGYPFAVGPWRSILSTLGFRTSHQNATIDLKRASFRKTIARNLSATLGIHHLSVLYAIEQAVGLIVGPV